MTALIGCWKISRSTQPLCLGLKYYERRRHGRHSGCPVASREAEAVPSRDDGDLIQALGRNDHRPAAQLSGNHVYPKMGCVRRQFDNIRQAGRLFLLSYKTRSP